MDASDLTLQIVERLKTVTGIEAVVLGGSRARGTHHKKSDIDLGIYYHPAAPLDLAELARAAAEIDDEHRANLVTGIGGWGPWINGGGWLNVAGMPVDFLYRDLEKVSRVIADCRDGCIEIAYQAGHPHAFESFIYLAEAALCRPLWDPQGTVASLKNEVRPYPPQLKRAIIAAFWWEVDFSLGIAHKGVSRNDLAYTAGCCFRGVTCLAQTLFAINEQYWMNEKGAVAIAAGFPLAPAHLEERVRAAFQQLSGPPEAMHAGITSLEVLAGECASWMKLAG